MSALLYKPVSDLSDYEKERIEEIVRPYYVDATELLKRALTHNNYIYLSYVDNTLAAFFMVAWENLLINGVDHPSLFLGLSCADLTFRNRRLTSSLYKQSVLDVAAWQIHHGKELIVWFTTATPIVWHVINNIYKLVQPNTTDFSLEEMITVQSIRQYHYPHAKLTKNPFVLKEVATATQYAFSERVYLTKSKKAGPTIFEQLGVDELLGDRLLVLCKLPDEEVIENHRQVLKNLLVNS